MASNKARPSPTVVIGKRSMKAVRALLQPVANCFMDVPKGISNLVNAAHTETWMERNATGDFRENDGGLNGSAQHLLGVYRQAF